MYQRKRVTASGLSKNPKAIAAIAACLVIVIVAVVLVVVLSGKDKGKDPDTTKQPQKTTAEQTSETTTEAPKPVGGEVPYLAWEEAQKKNPNYFNEAVFIGDSTGLKIMMYDGIPGMKYLCYGNYGTTNALDQSTATAQNGWPAEIWKQLDGRKRVYIMLGMNDLNRVGVEGAVDQMRQLCQLIVDNNDGALIYIQSMTPIIASQDGKRGKVLNNAGIKAYNEGLKKMAEENNWYFVDVASVMFNDAGYLKDEYCSDPGAMGIHLSSEGAKAWAEYNMNHCADPTW